MSETHQCEETGRTFATADEARASEARFREIQDACDAGRVPELRKGDVIYLESERFISHGCDDFCGGMAEVSEMQEEKIKGEIVLYVRVVQQPGALHNWHYLAGKQQELRRVYGTNWAHPDPDDRPEFNGYWM